MTGTSQTDASATERPRAVFRDVVLRRYAAGGVRDEPLRDLSVRLLILLWTCTGLLGCGLLALAVFTAALTR